MNQDQIDRDRLLSEVHANTKHIVQWSEKHDKKDDDRFAEVKSQISWMQKIIFMGLGIVAFLKFLIK